MDVKILPCKKGTECHSINEHQILLINQVNYESEEENEMFPFKRVEYSIYNTKTRVMERILPDLSKYSVGKLTFAGKQSNVIYFIHIEYPCFPMATFMVFCYDTVNSMCREVYRFEDDLRSYQNSKRLTLYILNDQYLMVQNRIKGDDDTYTYASYLYDTKNKLFYDILDERFIKQGISQLLPIANNVCAVRFGHNQLDNNKLIPRDKDKCSKETICLISISQFIADVLLKIKIVSSELIDEVYIEKTFSDIRISGKYLVFSRIDRNNGSQEIYYYQYITKETSMALNTNTYNPDRIFPCVMNNRPMLVREHKKYQEFFDVKSKKTVYKIPSYDKIEFSEQDFLVVCRTKKFFNRNNNEKKIIINQYSKQKMLYKEAFKPVKYQLLGKETLVILIEE